MAQFNAFLAYELRRSAPLIIAGWSFWPLLFLIHRSLNGHWRFWAENDFPIISAAALILILGPLLAVALVFSGWPQDRASGQFRWLMARPLSRSGLFLGRLLALAAALMVYLCGALLVNGFSPFYVLSGGTAALDPLPLAARSLWTLSAGWPLASWLLVSLLVIGLAVLVAVLSRSPGRALGWWVLVCAAAVGMAVSFQVYLQRIGQDLWWQPKAVAKHLLVHDSLWVMALGLAAWGVFRSSTTGPSKGLLGLLWGVPPAVLALTVLSQLLVHPSAGPDSRPILARAVDGGILELVQGPNTRRSISMLRLRRDDGTVHVWRDLPVTGMRLRLAPDRRRALVGGDKASGFQLLDLATLEAVPVVQTAGLHYVDRFSPGWSPEGKRFAWVDPLDGQRWSLFSIEQDGLLRRFEIPARGHIWEVSWLDDSSLLMSWLLLPADDWQQRECRFGVLALPGAKFLSEPRPFESWLDFIRPMGEAVIDARITTSDFGGRQPVCLPQEGGCELALLDPISGEVERAGVFLGGAERASLGATRGSLLWLAGESGGRRLVRRWKPGSGVETACEIPTLTGLPVPPVYSRPLAAEKGWAVWQILTRWQADWDGAPGRLVACHLATGRVRVVASERLGLGSAGLYQGELILPEGQVPLDG